MSTRAEKLAQLEVLRKRIGQTIEQAASGHAFMRTITWQHLPEETQAAYKVDVANLEFKLWAMLRDRMSLEVELNEDQKEVRE